MTHEEAHTEQDWEQRKWMSLKFGNLPGEILPSVRQTVPRMMSRGNQVVENFSWEKRSLWLSSKTWLLLSLNCMWESPSVEWGPRSGRSRMTRRQRRAKTMARRIERFSHSLLAFLLGVADVRANVVKGSDAKRSYLSFSFLIMQT